MAAIGVDSGGPGRGAGVRVHHQTAAAAIRIPKTMTLLRISIPGRKGIRYDCIRECSTNCRQRPQAGKNMGTRLW